MTELDAKLSALLDGELPPEEAAALRDEVARRPELAERLAELAAVDEALRALPARPVPGELRAQLAARLRAEQRAALHGAGSRRPAASRAEHREAVRSRSRRWLAAAAFAAAAAALALVALPRLRESGGPGGEPVARSEAEPLPHDLLDPSDEPGRAEVALAEDLPVIEVLDVLAELDELERVGSG